MRKLVFFLITGYMLLFYGCGLFDADACEETKKPEINFDLIISGTVGWFNESMNDYEYKGNLVVRIEFYKEHCGGKNSDQFYYVCSADKTGYVEKCGLGYTYGFHMNNEKDKIHLRFYYRKPEDAEFIYLDRKTLTYSSFASCPEYPPRCRAEFVFDIHIENADYLNPEADEVAAFILLDCKTI